VGATKFRVEKKGCIFSVVEKIELKKNKKYDKIKESKEREKKVMEIKGIEEKKAELKSRLNAEIDRYFEQFEKGAGGETFKISDIVWHPHKKSQ
jgi:hypothetical protein